MIRTMFGRPTAASHFAQDPNRQNEAARASSNARLVPKELQHVRGDAQKGNGAKGKGV
jgi:hypothetical protein